MKIPDIHIDLSKNIQEQILSWQIEQIDLQIDNYIPREKAFENIKKVTEVFINSKWNNEIFRNKLINDIMEFFMEDIECLKKVWDETKTDTPAKMDEIMDQFNEGKITKEEMQKQLEFHSITCKEVDWSK